MLRRSAFTIVELLVVIAVIVVLLAVLLPTLGYAREMARRMRCASNQRQFGLALWAYAETYRRYPHQRQVEGDLVSPKGETTLLGGPMLEGLDLRSKPISGVGWEFDEVLGLGLDYHGPRLASQPLPTAVQVLACPSFLVVRDPNEPNGTGVSAVQNTAEDDKYLYILGYFYVGGSHYWTNVPQTFSPIRPQDPSDWALAADIVMNRNAQWEFVAHRARSGEPAGSNHLYNDGHAAWVAWDGGANLTAVTDPSAAGAEPYYWRRTMSRP